MRVCTCISCRTVGARAFRTSHDLDDCDDCARQHIEHRSKVRELRLEALRKFERGKTTAEEWEREVLEIAERLLADERAHVTNGEQRDE